MPTAGFAGHRATTVPPFKQRNFTMADTPERRRLVRCLGTISLAVCMQALVSCGQAAPQDDDIKGALNSASCTILETLLEDIERGLDDVAQGTASRRPTTGVAVYAKEARDIAADGALPAVVEDALFAIRTEASSKYFFAEGAAVFLEQGLIIEQAMPKICRGSSTPGLGRFSGNLGD